MRHLLLPAKIIGVLWIIFSIGLSRTPKVNNNQAEFLIFAINVLGISSIAFLYGHSRGKKGLNASWIGKVFIILCASLPLLVIANKPWMDTVMNLAFSTVFVALTFYLPYRAGSKLGYQEYEAAEDKVWKSTALFTLFGFWMQTSLAGFAGCQECRKARRSRMVLDNLRKLLNHHAAKKRKLGSLKKCK